MRNRWTDEEIADLEKHYAEGGTGACKIALLRHTPNSIYKRANALNLAYNFPFNKEERRDIFRNYHKGGSRYCTVALKNHTQAEINRFVSRQRKRKDSFYRLPHINIIFSDEEKAEIRKFYPKLGLSGCPKSLQRHTKLAIYQWASRNNIAAPSRREYFD